jgi:universal stress protein F
MGDILVALDGSARSAHVIEVAVELARTTRRRLSLFRGFGLPPEIPKELWKQEESSLMDSLRKHASDYLDACARGIPRELLAGTSVGVGVPWQAVCAAAKEIQADLIIVGSHGYGGLDRLLGTTAAKVVNHAECSVLVVRVNSHVTSA